MTVNAHATQYRLYTERQAKADIVPVILRHLDGATILEGQGIWNGGEEASTIIEVIGDDTMADAIGKLAEDIRRTFHQQAVYVTHSTIGSILVDDVGA